MLTLDMSVLDSKHFCRIHEKHKSDKRAYTMNFSGGYNENSGEKSEMGRKMDEAIKKL
jgi:hypothetical protein